MSMKHILKKIVSIVLMFGIVFFWVCSSDAKEKVTTASQKAKPKPKPVIFPQQSQSKKARLTWVLFMAGDNNLEQYTDFNRKQFEREGVPEDLNILLYICTHRTHESKKATLAIVKGNKTNIFKEIPAVDSGQKEAVLQAIEWGASYGTDLAFTFWDHGLGPMNRLLTRGICYDNTTGHFLTDADIRDALHEGTTRFLNGRKMEFIAFDACLMGALEIATVIQPYAHYMIASEQTIPAVGWPYHTIVKAFKKGQKDTEDFSRAIVEAFGNYYEPLTQDYTLSLVQLDKIKPLADNANAVASTLITLLKKQAKNSVKLVIRDSFSQSTRFDEPSYADLYDWYKQLLLRLKRIKCIKPEDTSTLVGQLKTLLTHGIALISQTVLSSVQGNYLKEAHGLLMYLPEKRIDSSYLSCIWAKNTQWVPFLKAYLQT